MTAGAKRSTAPRTVPIDFDASVEAPRAIGFTVGVRTVLGTDLEGLEAHGDGISFCSPEPIEGGRIVELVLCRAILVEAQVVGCALMPGESSVYWVRARFYKTSPALTELICRELNRLMQLEA